MKEQQPLYIQESLELGAPTKPTARRRRVTPETTMRRQRELHEVIARYVDTDELRRLALNTPEQLHKALREPTPPQEISDLFYVLRAILMPPERQQIRSPADVAAALMIEMSHLDQEQFRTIVLDVKNRVMANKTLYIGSVNMAQIRVAEVYKEAVRRNGAAIIIAHNHPSADPTPSPEDVLVTRQIVEAGKLLDIECLDHLVIGQGRYVSMRERGLGFPA